MPADMRQAPPATTIQWRALPAAGVAPAEHPRYLVALRALAATEMIEPRR